MQHQDGRGPAGQGKRAFARSAGEAQAAFSLLEILVVIGIMALLAALTVGLVGVSGENKRVSTAKARIAKISLLIDTYKAKKGIYPPDNPNNFQQPTNTSLFYELAGVTNSGSGFLNPFGNFISKADLQTACGVGTILNVAAGDVEEQASRLALLPQVMSDETNSVVVNGVRIFVFVGPEGPDGRRINPVYYRVGSATNNAHNPDGYDLWFEVKTRKGGKVIGNWKE